MVSIPHVAGIYQILCIPTGKIYVGSTVDLRERWLDHRALLRRGKNNARLLQRAWIKYGEGAFEFSVLESVLLVEMLVEREQYWLDRLRSYEPERGFNIRRVADRNIGLSPSLETREKIRKALTGRKLSPEVVERAAVTRRGKPKPKEMIEKLRAINRTKKRTPEMKAHWSKVNKERGVGPTDEHRLRSVEVTSKWFVVTDPGGKSQLLRNLRRFCRENGLLYGGLRRVAAGTLPKYKGWVVRHASDDERPVKV